MVNTLANNSYLVSNLMSAGLSQGSPLVSTNVLTNLNLYRSSSQVQAYALTQTSGQRQGGQVTQQISSVWNSFSSLNTLAKTFTAKDNTSAFSQRTVTSSNAAAVTATSSGGSASASYSVGVSQLAAAQQNSGIALLANGTDLSDASTTASTYSFQMTINSGSQQTYYVNVKPGDQNQQVLQKMADAINAANSGGKTAVKAQVTTDVKGGAQYSKLVVTAANTGTDNAFSLTDASGHLSAASGVQGGTTVAAQNASYTVNGVAFTSQSNTAVIKNANITMTLSKTTQADVTLTVGQDAAGITAQMANFVKQYNATVNALKNSGLTMASKLISRLAQSSSSQAGDLETIGLTRNSDNTLSLDQSVFQQALTSNPNRTASLLSGYGDLASGVQSVAQSVTALPPSWLANTQNPYPGTDLSQSLSGQFQQYLLNSMLAKFAGSSGSYLDIAA
jgi:flagellar hook-associated protein 2